MIKKVLCIFIASIFILPVLYGQNHNSPQKTARELKRHVKTLEKDSVITRSSWEVVKITESSRKTVKELKRYVKTLEKDSVMSRTAWSLVVKDMRNGSTVVEKDPQLLLAGASITKLLTTGAALDYLGGDFRYETRLEYSGQVRDSTLYGTLYIVGGGDPTLGSGYEEFNASADTVFARWKDAMKKSGIARIKGTVVADDRYFTYEPAIPSWSWDDVSQTFGTGVRGLAFYDNLLRLYINPAQKAGETPVVDSIYPSLPSFSAVNAAMTVQTGKNTLYVENSPLHIGQYFIKGEIPLSYKTRRITMPNRAAGLSLASEFIRYMEADEKSANDVEYVLWDSDTPVTDTVEHHHIYTYISPALKEIASVTNKYSDNMFAETILRTIGKVSGAGDGTEYALKKEREILDGIAPGVKVINQLDGSGLSRNAFLNTEYYAEYLYGMSHRDVFDDFYRTLAVPGSAGTYRNSLKDVPTRTRLHLKSGSLSIARAVSGYAGEGDRMLCFSLMVNRYHSSSQVAERINKLLEILSRY